MDVDAMIMEADVALLSGLSSYFAFAVMVVWADVAMVAAIAATAVSGLFSYYSAVVEMKAVDVAQD